MLNDEQLAKLRKAGEVSAAARDLGISLCKPGAKLLDIAQEVEGYIRDHGCGVAFPCNLSINEVAAHYTPTPNDQTRLEIGDVIKVDCGAVLDGYIGDTAATVEVATNAYRDLVEASKRAREIISGSLPLIDTKETKPLSIAIEEINRKLITYTRDEAAEDEA